MLNIKLLHDVSHLLKAFSTLSLLLYLTSIKKKIIKWIHITIHRQEKR